MGDACRMTRRRLLGAAAAATAAPYVITSAALGGGGRPPASDRIVMGAIGVGRRGRYDLKAFLGHADVQVAAVCDVQGERRAAAKQDVDAAYGSGDCRTYIDLRELLERRDIDAVLIATGDNWHSPASVLAARAGKDIYCEKPLGMAIAESRAVVEAVGRYGVVFQCGTHRRNVGQFRFAVELARSGRLGRLTVLHAARSTWWVETYRDDLAGEPPPPRERLDWDLWLGPARRRPYNARYLDRMYWGGHLDFAGGSITEWGSHTADLCQWANDADDTSAVTYEPTGDTVAARYANGVELLFVPSQGAMHIRLEGTGGWALANDDGRMETHPAGLRALGHGFRKAYHPADHVRDFLDCVRSRREPTSPAHVVHRSLTTCHCANICLRLGRKLRWDPAREEFVGDDEANRLRSRPCRAPWRL